MGRGGRSGLPLEERQGTHLPSQEEPGSTWEGPRRDTGQHVLTPVQPGELGAQGSLREQQAVGLGQKAPEPHRLPVSLQKLLGLIRTFSSSSVSISNSTGRACPPRPGSACGMLHALLLRGVEGGAALSPLTFREDRSGSEPPAPVHSRRAATANRAESS